MDLISWTFDSDVDDKDRPLLCDTSDVSRSLSYNQLRSYVRRLVAGLQSIGIQQGDCICVNSFNDVFYSVLYLGIIGSGAVFTGVNPAYTTNELVHHFRLTQPKILIVEPQLLSNTLAAASEVGLHHSRIYAFDVATQNSETSIQSWDVLLAHGERDWVTINDANSTVAQYASTSGTSGLPKAAMLPHSYHVTQAELRLTHGKLPYKARRLTALPPFHVFATPIIPSSVREGITTYVMRRFDMRGFVAAIERFGISETFLPPPCIIGLPQTPYGTRESLVSLRQIWFGGASLKYGNQLPMYELLHPDAKIQPVWGMTEAGWITAGHWEEKHEDDSVGRYLSCFEVKIVDDDDNELKQEGSTGNIMVRSPCMMLGYLANEAATREAFDNNGWLRTGDIGYRVDGNKIFVVDRKKDMIKVRGWQVSPAEVENTIVQHPSVLDAAVVGIEREDKSEMSRAYVVLAPGAELSIEELKTFIGQTLAKYKIPEEFEFTDRIPKNATGKILRRLLREQATVEDTSPESPKESFCQPSEGRWRHIRRMSAGSIKTISLVSRTIRLFLSWLKSVLVIS
ncbi:uncharacterized protein PV09_00544 [Verruconis gallopava]|uniref:AMP-dependent synthetase/ligase domain-containing protein n=1 Tax=Verruconis gallopava TaxID=253628 RepID=A0A0D2AQ16_9PEZI|nr:uncharacterized protein PV09_00544 [Verruconis gallopava]KIW08580.1 hypothetical protein PV09_00544 [Verruconis gallopava]